MSGSSGDLLRMLEPAVRPVGPASSRPQTRPVAPLERRDFATLLREAEQTSETDASRETHELASERSTNAKEHALSELSGIDAVENESLRKLVLQGRESE